MASNSNYARSPLMDNVLNFVPEGHEKALKQAMYNAVGMVLVCIGGGALTAVYFVLQPFLRPLLWALFFGSVLHPVKKRLNAFVHGWMGDLRSSNTPFAVGLLLLPIGVVDSVADGVVNSVWTHWRLFTAVTVTLVAPYWLYTYTPTVIITLSLTFKDLVFYLLTLLMALSPFLVWSLSTGFVLSVVFYWRSDTKASLCVASLFIWTLLVLHFSTVFGSLAALIAIAVLVIGLAVEVNDAINEAQRRASEEEGDSGGGSVESPIRTTWSVLCGKRTPLKTPFPRNKVVVDAIPTTKGHYGLIPAAVPAVEKPYPKYFPWADRRFIEILLGVHPSKEPLKTPPPPPSAGPQRRQSSFVRQDSLTSLLSTDNVDKISDVYMYILLWACFLVLVSRTFSWSWPLFLIAFLYLITKKLGGHLGVWSLLWTKVLDGSRLLFDRLGDREEALFPAPVRGLLKLLIRGDSWIISLMEKMADLLTTFGSIMFVLLFVVLAAIFLLLQIHAESMHLVQVTSNLINSSVVHNELVQNMLPDGISDVMDSMYDNAYEYGKEWAVKMVRHLIPEEDEEKSIIIEVQVLELWDKVYNTWMLSGMDGSSQVPSNASGGSASAGGVFGNIFGAAPELFNYSSMVAFVKENVDTFVAVIQASWSVLKGNISLALSALTATLSIVFGGGSALISFLFNLIVFLTALFYLLSSSGAHYSPLVFVSRLSPGGWGNKFGHAVEQAINGVFTASLKMAVFYGLWTWLIHKIFQVKMVYIPSVLAAIFGAIPFLGTYWAVLPAVMELWLVQGNWMLSLVIVIFQILPMSCVDTAIYSEIQGGGHPYLTGLSVAGGMFCLGVEGAIVGPLILCCFFVVVNMSTSMINESPVATPGKRLFSKTFLTKRCLA